MVIAFGSSLSSEECCAAYSVIGKISSKSIFGKGMGCSVNKVKKRLKKALTFFSKSRRNTVLNMFYSQGKNTCKT